jgi:hypothetical protein
MQNKEVILGRDGKPMYECITTAHLQQAFIWQEIYGSLPLLRVGFVSPVPPRHVNNASYVHDSRPIAWPVYHPYWITRMTEEGNVIMAYVESLDDIKTYWPEATDVTVFQEGCTRYGFNANFAAPTWLKEVHAADFEVKPSRCGVWRIENPELSMSLVGYSEDCDYAIQLNNHQLEYGVHEDKDFQEAYTSWTELEVTYRPTNTLEQARILGQQLIDFDKNEGDIETTLNMDD